MAETVVSVGEFRQRATEYIRMVEQSRRPIVIARRGVPVAELRPLSVEALDLRGSLRYTDGVDLSEPAVTPEEWEALA